MHIGHDDGAVFHPGVGERRVGHDDDGRVRSGEHGRALFAAFGQIVQHGSVAHDDEFPRPPRAPRCRAQPRLQNAVEQRLRHRLAGIAAQAAAARHGVQHVHAGLGCELGLIRQNFQPAAVGVFDEVQPHGLVHVANAAHLLMQCAGRFVVVDGEGQMRVAAAVVVGFGAPAVPGEFQLEARGVAAHEHVGPRAVLGPHAANLGHAERLLVKRDRLLQIQHMQAPVNSFPVHAIPFSSVREDMSPLAF